MRRMNRIMAAEERRQRREARRLIAPHKSLRRVHVVGAVHYQDNLRRVASGSTKRGERAQPRLARLRLEPGGARGSEAIAVDVLKRRPAAASGEGGDPHHVGYLPRNSPYHPILTSLRGDGHRAAICNAHIRAAEPKSWRDTPLLTVYLWLPDPEAWPLDE